MSLGQSGIMSFNIRYDNPDDGENWWEFRKYELCDLLQYYQADFIGIQEALPHQSKYIADKLDAYDFIGHGRDGINTISEGVPLFYNKTTFKLLEHELFWLSDTPDKVSKGWDAALNRIVVFGAFENKSNGDIVYIFNCHFDHKGKTAREKSAELLIQYIESKKLSDKSVIVLGDFNSLPTEKPIKILSQHLEDSFHGSHRSVYGPIGTFNAFETERVLTKRIDYIFTKNMNVKSYRSIDDKRKNNLYPSDHLPILIKLK